MIDTPQIIQTTPQHTAFIHLTVTLAEMMKVFGPTVGELLAALAAQGVAPAGPLCAHHLRRPADTFDFELSFPVSAPVQAAGRVQPGVWPARRAARTIHHGSYEGLGESWTEFMDWIETNGHTPAPDFYESYVTQSDTHPDPADWCTELTRPLAD